MKRPIKFRVWDVLSKDMSKTFNLEDFAYDQDFEDGEHNFNLMSYRAGAPALENELMQFTGLLDKNGKEIYEGDIVKYDWKDPMAKRSQRIGAVEWCEKYCDYRITTSDDMWKSALDMLELEVIGNIHEHPSLLNKNN